MVVSASAAAGEAMGSIWELVFLLKVMMSRLPSVDSHWTLLIIIGHLTVIMSTMASQIIGVSIVCSIVCSGAYKENIKAPHHRPL